MNRRGPKYNNRRQTVNGITFDSRREAERWTELRILQRAGVIQNLKRQVPYELIPTQRDGKGKLIEHSCDYIADFEYDDEEGNHIVEDAKGCRTREYIIKRKLMLKVYGIRIREV